MNFSRFPKNGLLLKLLWFWNFHIQKFSSRKLNSEFFNNKNLHTTHWNFYDLTWIPLILYFCFFHEFLFNSHKTSYWSYSNNFILSHGKIFSSKIFLREDKIIFFYASKWVFSLPHVKGFLWMYTWDNIVFINIFFVRVI